MKNTAADLGLTDQLTPLEQTNETLSKVFKKDRGSALTEQLTQLDQERDETLICIGKMADAFFNHHDQEKKLAGERVLKVLDKYGPKIYYLNYQAETSAVENLVLDVTTIPELKQAVELLPMTDLFERLGTKNTAFNQIFLKRVSEEAAAESISAGEVIKEGIGQYRELADHTVAHATLKPEQGYDALIKELNVLIDKYNALMANRGETSNEVEEEAEGALE